MCHVLVDIRIRTCVMYLLVSGYVHVSCTCWYQDTYMCHVLVDIRIHNCVMYLLISGYVHVSCTC